ncbi:hypothetical protein ACHAXR_005439, partial [Thalassiosira sp. AJA248-18]
MNATGDSNNAQPNTFNFSATADGNNGNNSNALILSLYLIDSEDDILHADDINASDSSSATNKKSNNNSDQIKKRAHLYQRLCKACAIANDVLRSSALDNGSAQQHPQSNNSPPQTTTSKHHLPWSSGGDGPIFGIHCDITNDEYFNATNDVDGDDIWQSKSPPPNIQQSLSTKSSSSDEQKIRNVLQQNEKKRRMAQEDSSSSSGTNFQQQQPHLRAICHYNNDINDMWRCISLALQISSKLSSQPSQNNNLSCAIECWDANDGHILLIEAAEYLPSWVDDDVLQGGVGGPGGCRNRCWIVDGEVHLIPPSSTTCNTQATLGLEESVDRISRKDALCALMKSTIKKEVGGGSSKILTGTVAPETVQCAIQDRINRTDYYSHHVKSRRRHDKDNNSPTHPKGEETNDGKEDLNNPHWHIAAAALPASVARFIQKHPSLVPLLVDSFCEHAPAYLKERSSPHHCKQNSETANTTDPPPTAEEEEEDTNQDDGTVNPQQKDSNSNNSSQFNNKNKNTMQGQTTKSSSPQNNNDSFGTLFPYEQIVILPITVTRTNYAELVTGRGIVPSFPTPTAYRSVELNRFQRQLRHQSASFSFGSEEDDETTIMGGAKKKKKNPFERAVDVGIRLCAGLDWIVSTSNNSNDNNIASEGPASELLEDSAIQTLGEV